jgi:hypothetical protein
MSIHMLCPSCRCKVNAPDKAVGRKAKCPKCGSAFIVNATEPVPPPQRQQSPVPLSLDAEILQPLPPAISQKPDGAPYAGIDVEHNAKSDPSTRRSQRQGGRSEPQRQSGQPSQKTLLIALGGMLVLMTAGIAILFATGVLQLNSGGSKKNKQADKPEVPMASPNDAAEAKLKVKAVLDDWTLGKSEEALKLSHPEIKASVFGIGMYRILKYEIVTEGGKEGYFGYEFAVIIVYQSEAGTEIKKNAKFYAKKDGNIWNVSSMGG